MRDEVDDVGPEKGYSQPLSQETVAEVATPVEGPNRGTGTGGGSQQVFPSRYQVGLFAVLGAVLLVAFAPREDTDLWWHLKDGAYIWAHHSVPRADLFSFTFAGHAWVDHEWLTELLLYGLYSVSGHWGPIVFFACVICATFGFVYARMAIYNVNRILALFILSAAFFASSATWGARPQMLTLFFLALFAVVLDHFLRKRDRRVLYVLPIFMLLWANLHGGWVLGLVLLAAVCAGEFANRRAGMDGCLDRRDLQVLCAVSLACVIATLFNPNGISQVLYPLVWIFPTAYANVLNEWVSPDFHQPVNVMFEALLLLFMVSLFASRTRINWTHIFLALIFTHLALAESRNVAVWAVVMSPLVALYVHRAIGSRAAPSSTPARPGRSIPARTQRIINLTFLGLVLVLYPIEAFHYISNSALQRNERTDYPVNASVYLAHHRLPANIFANYAWGGYVIWKLYPQYRDFIDGRANTLFNVKLLNDYLTAAGAGAGWKGVLDGHHVGTVLVSPDSPLAEVLKEDSGWRRVYKDGTAVVFTRRSGQSG